MTFKRFVEVGRVCVITYGKDAGKLCTIVEIVDGTHVLVDGPEKITGISRQVIGLKRVMLTDIKVAITRHARQKQLCKAWERANALATFQASSWGKKIARREEKAGMTDFDRFQQRLEKQKLAKAIKAKLA